MTLPLKEIVNVFLDYGTDISAKECKEILNSRGYAADFDDRIYESMVADARKDRPSCRDIFGRLLRTQAGRDAIRDGLRSLQTDLLALMLPFKLHLEVDFGSDPPQTDWSVEK